MEHLQWCGHILVAKQRLRESTETSRWTVVVAHLVDRHVKSVQGGGDEVAEEFSPLTVTGSVCVCVINRRSYLRDVLVVWSV